MLNAEMHPVPAPSVPVREPAVLLGVLKGEGIGAEVISATLQVARAAADRFAFDLQIESGGVIGLEARGDSSGELSPGVVAFCSGIFARGGAILSGPVGGRYVYDLRRQFQLFCKVNPLTSYPELDGVSRLRASRGKPRPDILLVRENLDGIYQGESKVVGAEKNARVLAHTFRCSETHTRLLLKKACRLAANRTGRIAVVVKRGALAEISALWQDCAEEEAQLAGVQSELIDIDFAVYRFLQSPHDFDVIAAPNCFGDILADAGGVLCGSRGLTYGASYSTEGFGVYQTNHGCAHDIAGRLQANPVGQIFSLAMLLRESCRQPLAADAVVGAVRRVWAQGFRTADLMEDGGRLVATDTMAERIAEALRAEGPGA